MPYLYLAAAIVAEVIGTTALKATGEFTKLGPSIIVIMGYGISFYLLAIVLKTIPLGVAYALWSGLGIVLVALAGALFYRQVPDLPAILGMLMIIMGAVIMNLFSKTVGH